MAIAIAAMALLAGCSNNAPTAAIEDPKVASAAVPDKAAVPAETAPAVVAPPATAPAADAKPALENSVGEASVPFILTLSGPASLPDTGSVEITAKISAAHEFKVPATLSIAVPKGATLSSGKASEAMTSVPAGDTTRVFKIALTGKLDQPIRIALDAKDPAGSAGAHAERVFPADFKPATKPGSAVPPPPVGRPGGAAVKH